MKKLLVIVLTALALAGSVQAAAFSFGVMGDTQWTCANDPAGTNPGTVSASIANQLNQQFINKGVKFVVQVGDLTDTGTDANIAARAAAAQSLYNAGIGFFPMRGNHETYGTNNNLGIPAMQADFPQTQGTSNTFGATNFSSPTAVSSDLNGMSYSFDYTSGNSSARFVIIDNWATPTKNVSAAGYTYGYTIADQQNWISSQLNQATRGTGTAFVFSHQPMIAESHQDSPFVGYTNANPDMQNAFISSLQSNGVKYYISGHDHIDQNSIITSPDGLSSVHEQICASASSKFYTPTANNNANWFGQKTRETSVSQDMYHVGYYIYTVNGPRVTIDYYADNSAAMQSDASYPNGPSGAGTHITPNFNFAKVQSYGYSTNGKEVDVLGGNAFNISDSTAAAVANGELGYKGTIANLLGNTSAITDYTNRTLTQAINTGWTPGSAVDASDILTVWGTKSLGYNNVTSQDSFNVQLSYDASVYGDNVALAQVDDNGGFLGVLSSASIDTASHTISGLASADGNFVVIPEPATLTLIAAGLVVSLRRNRK